MPEWWKLTSETTQNYFYDAIGTQQIVSSLINYDYNINNFQVNKTTTTNSKGQVVIQKTTYPVDYTSSTYSDMKLRNIISKPIETITMIDGTVTRAQLNTFTPHQLWPDGEVQIGYFPEFVYSFKSTNGPTEITFTKYDGTTPSSTYYKEDLRYDLRNFRGDPLQITVSQAKKYTYLWGYNQNYPVAQVENAIYAQVEALSAFGSGFSIPASLSVPQETSLRTNLPNSMVTTYTYNPLIGVSTITDPKTDKITYTYDSFGRLQFVKDPQGNILSENQYNYKP
jgi:YD repeat-containing protein